MDFSSFDYGAGLQRVLNAGLDVWVDSEKPRPYSAGVQDPTTRDSAGNAVTTGQSASTLTASVQNNPAVWIGGAVVIVLLIVLALK